MPRANKLLPGSLGEEEEAYGKALNYLGYRPRTEREVMNRLRKWGFGRQTIDSVVGRLEAGGLIDDLQFALDFMEELLRGDSGYFRVRAKLLSKKLDRGLVEEVMQAYPSEHELERAIRLLERKSAKIGGENDSSSYQRLRNHLLRKGYSSAIVDQALRAVVVDTEFTRE